MDEQIFIIPTYLRLCTDSKANTRCAAMIKWIENEDIDALVRNNRFVCVCVYTEGLWDSKKVKSNNYAVSRFDSQMNRADQTKKGSTKHRQNNFYVCILATERMAANTA